MVIMIVGLLAAIAIPAFLGQRAKANDATAKSSVRTAQTALEAYRVDHGDYCGATAADLKAIETALMDSNNLTVSTCQGGNTSRYSLAVTSRSSLGTVYGISLDGGAVVARPCSTPDEGGCALAGTW